MKAEEVRLPPGLLMAAKAEVFLPLAEKLAVPGIMRCMAG
jgi:hypothetical protein